MPWIREATVKDARDAITKGARLSRCYWPDADPAHLYLGSFVTAQAVSFEAKGYATITHHHYSESSRHPHKITTYLAPDDVVAIVAMTEMAPGVDTYANHDDRLIVPGGWMDAHPGTMHRTWDVFRIDGTQIGYAVSVGVGRELLA